MPGPFVWGCGLPVVGRVSPSSATQAPGVRWVVSTATTPKWTRPRTPMTSPGRASLCLIQGVCGGNIVHVKPYHKLKHREDTEPQQQQQEVLGKVEQKGGANSPLWTPASRLTTIVFLVLPTFPCLRFGQAPGKDGPAEAEAQGRWRRNPPPPPKRKRLRRRRRLATAKRARPIGQPDNRSTVTWQNTKITSSFMHFRTKTGPMESFINQHDPYTLASLRRSL